MICKELFKAWPLIAAGCASGSQSVQYDPRTSSVETGARVPVRRVSAQRGLLYLIKGCGSIEFQERRVIVIADATTLGNVFPAVLRMSSD